MIWNVYLRRVDNGQFLCRFDKRYGARWTSDINEASRYRSLDRVHATQRCIKIRTRVVSDHDLEAERLLTEGGTNECLRTASGR